VVPSYIAQNAASGGIIEHPPLGLHKHSITKQESAGFPKMTEKQTSNRMTLYTFGAIATLLFFAAYFDTFTWLYGRYVATDSYYSHGFLIPLIVGFLVWTDRKSLSSLTPEFCPLGLAITALSLIIHLIGTFVHFFFVSGVSLFLFLFGTTLFLFGKSITKRLIFPILFVAFMIPLPLPLISSILFPMKLAVVKVSSEVTRLMGIPVFVEGFNVHLAKGVLLIGNPCSGLRSLIAFLAMGALVGYLSTNSWKKMLFIILLSIPIAFVSNMARSVTLVLVANRWGSAAASPDRWFHDFSGFAVFAFGLSILLIIVRSSTWRTSETVS